MHWHSHDEMDTQKTMPPRISFYDEDCKKGVKHAKNGKKTYMTPSPTGPTF